MSTQSQLTMNYENEIESGAIALVCNGLGLALRQSPIPDWLIPLILPVAGFVGACLLDGWTGHAAIKGIVSGFTAVGMNQLVRQGKEGGQTIIMRKKDVQ